MTLETLLVFLVFGVALLLLSILVLFCWIMAALEEKEAREHCANIFNDKKGDG